MALASGVVQAVGGYAYVSLFEAAHSYTPVFPVAGAAMAPGAVVALHLRRPVEANPGEPAKGSAHL